MKHVILKDVFDVMTESQQERYNELIKNFSLKGLNALLMLMVGGFNDDGTPVVCYKLSVYMGPIKLAEEPRLINVETILTTLSRFLEVYKIIDIEV